MGLDEEEGVTVPTETDTGGGNGGDGADEVDTTSMCCLNDVMEVEDAVVRLEDAVGRLEDVAGGGFDTRASGEDDGEAVSGALAAGGPMDEAVEDATTSHFFFCAAASFAPKSITK